MAQQYIEYWCVPDTKCWYFRYVGIVLECNSAILASLFFTSFSTTVVGYGQEEIFKVAMIKNMSVQIEAFLGSATVKRKELFWQYNDQKIRVKGMHNGVEFKVWNQRRWGRFAVMIPETAYDGGIYVLHQTSAIGSKLGTERVVHKFGNIDEYISTELLKTLKF